MTDQKKVSAMRVLDIDANLTGLIKCRPDGFGKLIEILIATHLTNGWVSSSDIFELAGLGKGDPLFERLMAADIGLARQGSGIVYYYQMESNPFQADWESLRTPAPAAQAVNSKPDPSPIQLTPPKANMQESLL